MVDKNPTKSEILGIVEAQSESTKEISERLLSVERKLSIAEGSINRFDTKNDNIIYAVVIGLFFIVVTVAVEVVLSNSNANDSMSTFFEKVNKLDDEFSEKNAILNNQVRELSTQMDLLRARNQYLK